MSIQEIRQTAFAKWLLLQTRQDALTHLRQCLMQHDCGNNLALDLLGAVGGWIPTNETLNRMLDSLAEGK